jgi:hypothetical protein
MERVSRSSCEPALHRPSPVSVDRDLDVQPGKSVLAGNQLLEPYLGMWDMEK